MKTAKLDMYDYNIVELGGNKSLICITVDYLDLVDIADIATDITQTNGKIYLEGKRYIMLDMKVVPPMASEPFSNEREVEILVRESNDEGKPRIIETNCRGSRGKEGPIF